MFPSIVDFATTSNSGTSDSITNVNLPVNRAIGDLLFVFIRAAGGPDDIAVGSGEVSFTQLASDDSDDSNDRTALFYRVIDGTENSTVVFTHATGRAAAITYTVTNAADPSIQPPEMSIVLTGNSTKPNSNEVTPTGGVDDFLFMSIMGVEGKFSELPSYPSGYPDYRLAATTETSGSPQSNCQVFVASRQAHVASSANITKSGPPILQGDIWTLSSVSNWTAWILAIHPISV